jgi:hypothetical protein
MQISKRGRALVLAAVAVGSAAFASVSKAGTIAGWTFESEAITNPITVTNNPVAEIGSGTASSIGMTNVYGTPNPSVTSDDVLLGTTGSGGDTGTNGLADTTQIWRVRGQAAPGGGAANGWSSLAPIGTQGAIFSASTAGYNAINVAFDWYATNQGEANMQLAYTTNGTTYTNIPVTVPAGDADVSVVTNTGTDPLSVVGSYVHITGGQQWAPGLTATIADPLAANNPNFAIEMVSASTGASDVSAKGGALNNNSGNWRFDNVFISGTPVPEPATVSLVGLAGLALLNRRRSRSK